MYQTVLGEKIVPERRAWPQLAFPMAKESRSWQQQRPISIGHARASNIPSEHTARHYIGHCVRPETMTANSMEEGDTYAD